MVIIEVGIEVVAGIGRIEVSTEGLKVGLKEDSRNGVGVVVDMIVGIRFEFKVGIGDGENFREIIVGFPVDASIVEVGTDEGFAVVVARVVPQ
jgi:hypothetical protein